MGLSSRDETLTEHPYDCRRCGKPFIKDGLLMTATIGTFAAKWKCPRCKKYAYLKRPDKCWYCGTLFAEKQWKVFAINPNERVKSDIPCDVCIKEIVKLNEIVKAGGAFYTCLRCGGQGVIKACDAIAELREKMGTPIPQAVTVSMPSCKNCKEEDEKETESKETGKEESSSNDTSN